VAVREAYHHKDLRNALLAEAVAVLEEAGPSKLSLRELARRLGVAHTAAYAHFPHKTALLREVAELGFTRLADALKATKSSGADPAQAFLAMGQAYVCFAHDQPSLYRLMFVDEELCDDPDSDMSPEGQRAFAILAATIAELGVAQEAVRETSIAVWGMVHGIAMLDIDLRISGKTMESGEAIAALGGRIFLRGLSAC
jgi:AcrR family transcriptional regulator